MTIQQWRPDNLPVINGFYMRFVKKANDSILAGSRGTVAIPVYDLKGELKAGEFAFINRMGDLDKALGEDSTSYNKVRLALIGGAREVLVYGMDFKPTTKKTRATKEGDEGTEELPTVTSPTEKDFKAAREAFEGMTFNVFTYGEPVGEDTHKATLQWLDEQRNLDKAHFFYVAGGSDEDDADVKKGIARAELIKDESVFVLINGGSYGDELFNSALYAAKIAGEVSGLQLNESITFSEQEILSSVNKRLTFQEQEDAVKAGCMFLISNGKTVRVQNGLTTDGGKIRKTAVKHAIATDLNLTAEQKWIGKVTNLESGQLFVISGIEKYLDVMADRGIITEQSVRLDPEFESKDDKMFLLIEYVEVDSAERILVTTSTEG